MKLINTKIKIPQKYQHMIEEIEFEGKEDGYGIYLKKGFCFDGGLGGHTAFEFNQKDVLNKLKDIGINQNEIEEMEKMKTLYINTKKKLEAIKGIEDTKEAILKLENLVEDLEDRVDEMLCYNDPSILKLEVEIEELQTILERKLEFEEGEKG